jgi:hypothetical protein
VDIASLLPGESWYGIGLVDRTDIMRICFELFLELGVYPRGVALGPATDPPINITRAGRRTFGLPRRVRD